jgi:hypothetical protein
MLRLFETAQLNRLEVNCCHRFTLSMSPSTYSIRCSVPGPELQLLQQRAPQPGLSIPRPEAFGFAVTILFTFTFIL